MRNHPTARLYTRSSLALALLASPGSILVDEALDRCRRVAKNSSLALILHVVMNRSDNGQNCAAKKNKKQPSYGILSLILPYHENPF